MKKLGLGSILFFVGLTLFAQNEAVSASYVSRIRTDVEGSYIKLLWKDVSTPGVKYVVYRYTHELTSSNLNDAEKLAVVPAGQESYLDQPSDKRDYFYAVLVQDASGKINDIFVPFRNVTTEPASVKTLVGEQPAYADVTSLQAHLSGRSIELSFKSSAPNRELVVYRGTSPIENETDLLSALSVGVLPSSRTSFEDTPVPGISYYYAIIDSSMLADGKVTLAPGENTTTAGIEVPIKTNASGQIEYAPKRPRPLPFLTLGSNLETGTRLAGSTPSAMPEETPLSRPTTAAVDSLLGSLPPQKPVEMKPSVLDSEKGAVAGGGEEYTLKSIVDGPFSASDWKKAISALSGYLNIRHSQPVENRARYYLGQAYYFAGDYRQSFLEFLFVENALYPEVQPWMDALLRELHSTSLPAP